MKPADLSLPPKFRDFRSHTGFSQWDLIKRITLAFRDYRFVLLHAPPGAGKTLIAAAVQQLLSLMSNRAMRMLFLTPSRGLQDQLENEFATVKVVKGRSNYYCPEFRGGCDLPALCDAYCSIEKPGNNLPTRCPYRIAIERAAESPSPCGNYAFWLSLAKYGDPDALGDIDLLVCDEAHAVLDSLTEFASIVLKPDDMRLINSTLPRFERIDQWSAWADRNLDRCADAITIAQESRIATAKDKARLNTLYQSLYKLAHLDEDEDNKWIADTRAADIKISPLWPGERTESLLFRDIPRVLLCSGSLTPDIVADLGIDKQEAVFIEVASTSPARNRPVIYLRTQPEVKVEHSMSKGEERAIVRKIDDIIDVWGEHKGMILTTSYDWVGIIKRNSKYGYESESDFLISHDRGRVADAINRYRNAEKGVLLSPALWEGYDFPECSWLVFLKIPFVDSRDPLMAARKKARKGFANSIIAARLLQGSMRHIRSHTAKGVVFILDWHWTHFQKSAYFPEYYRAAWRVRDTIPTPKESGL